MTMQPVDRQVEAVLHDGQDGSQPVEQSATAVTAISM
jgi:hypothetical protein